MLTPYSRSKFITKILTSPAGEQYRVVFLVALVNGEVTAQMVSYEPLAQAKTEPVCLSAPFVKTPVSFTYTPSFIEKLPLFNTIFFYNSQPTRAPAF